MQQVLFTLPILKGSFPPDGIPMYGFGAMLFVCFVAVTVWGSRRAKRTADMPQERFQDMVIWLFVSGILGARILYMIQYANNFPDQSIAGLLGAFFKIWEGGIIFYGSALGGTIGYGLFYWFVLRRLHIDGWKLADAVAPLLALGLAIGRIGCYLNGCCWGQVACEECRVGAARRGPLPAAAGARAADCWLRDMNDLQTTTGFTLEPRPRNPLEDPASVAANVEAGSPAAKAGVRPGDRVVGVNGEPNGHRRRLRPVRTRRRARKRVALKVHGAEVVTAPGGKPRARFDTYEGYKAARASTGPRRRPRLHRPRPARSAGERVATRPVGTGTRGRARRHAGSRR